MFAEGPFETRLKVSRAVAGDRKVVRQNQYGCWARYGGKNGNMRQSRAGPGERERGVRSGGP